MSIQSNHAHPNLETLSQMMPGAFLWKKDLNSIYTDLNPDCAELFGISKKRDISGFTDHEIPCKISEFAETFRQHDQHVISTGKPLQILEVHNCSKDQLKIMLNTKNPLLDEGNNIVGDISKRTVEKHIEHIKIKLDCATKSHLIDKAIDLGLYRFISHNDL